MIQSHFGPHLDLKTIKDLDPFLQILKFYGKMFRLHEYVLLYKLVFKKIFFKPWFLVEIVLCMSLFFLSLWGGVGSCPKIIWIQPALDLQYWPLRIGWKFIFRNIFMVSRKYSIVKAWIFSYLCDQFAISLCGQIFSYLRPNN